MSPNHSHKLEAKGHSGGNSGRGGASSPSVVKPGGPPAPPLGRPPAGADATYYFSLKSELTPVDNKAGTVEFEVPEGVRLHVNYKSEKDQVSTDGARLVKRADWSGLTGTILSGGDWVLVQKNGVARFDARVTIQTADKVLIDAVFTGAVDLQGALKDVNVGDPKDLGKAVYDRYLSGPPDYDHLPVALSVRFEAAQQPYLRQGEDDSWIRKSRYARQSDNFPTYQRLVRGLFVARGKVTLHDAKRWPPTSIELDIFEL